jgi:hypothetical protein
MASFYEDASLVVIPSGYKTSKIYAEKPTDGSGDLTFTRASGATRVASNGLIEKVRTNLLTYSQDFSNAAWIVDAGLTKTLSQTDPNGGTTAALFSGTSGSNLTVGHAVTLTANVPNTISIWIKGSASGSVSLRIDDSGAGPQYDINYTTSWQRFSVTKTVDQSSCVFVVGGYFTWGVGENIYLAFGQAETGDIATDYIPTTTAAVSVGPVSNVPRLDYLGSTCPRLNLEPQRTNVITYSEDVTTWGQNQTPVVTLNNGTAPDGYQGADKVVVNAASEGFYNFSGGNVTSGTTYTTSIFIKYISGATNLYFGFAGTGFGGDNYNSFNIQNGTVSSSAAGNTCSVVSYGNGWYRLINTKTASATNTGGFILYGVGSPEVQYFVWGAQLEAGAYATSYIPTLGASVTRVADAASKTGISSLIGQTEGTLYVEIDFNGTGFGTENDFFIYVGNGSNTSSIYIDYYNNLFRFVVFTGGSLTAYFDTATTNGTHKIALAYKSGSYAAYKNGVQIGVDAAAANPPTCSIFSLKGGASGFGSITNNTKQALLFKTRLTNAQLAELTTL